MVRARKYVLKKHYTGAPKFSDYELVEYELPPLKDGEILVKTEWISVDPYLRAYSSMLEVPYDQFGLHVAIVQESKDPDYPVGTRVVTHKGWCDFTIVDTKAPIEEVPRDIFYKLPDLKGLSPSLGVGAIGMPGATAYFALIEVCQLRAGDTVAITGAAGAVGTIAGQIAKLKGCKVIGFTGADVKVKWLENELGFDKALNYKKVNLQTALKEAAPNGVDIYFDNVGGEISSIIMGQMNTFGKVVAIGSISSYNADPTQMPKVTILQPCIVFKRLKIEGYLIWDSYKRWPEAFTNLITWIKEGKIKTPEHITEGFTNVFEAFRGMLDGENIGKAIVKV
ncbi:unnamed protein product [Euphydryas editha]|uniref:Prostaglandin reductase 1 n=1 Tax=Euphydryas editha TaxID=104508 RepID=A0AAU9V2F1_EUPED|nr:unnamed protein product [Euphydryas editha]